MLITAALDIVISECLLSNQMSDPCSARLVFEEFIQEGGVQSLVQVMQEHIDQEGVLNACIPALTNLVNDKKGREALIKLGGIKAMTAAISGQCSHCEAGRCCHRTS